MSKIDYARQNGLQVDQVLESAITEVEDLLLPERKFVQATEHTPSIYLPLASNLINKGGQAVSFTRASGAYYPDDKGVYRFYSNNIPAFNSKGMFIEPARTNFCTNFNAAPVVDAAITTSSGTVSVVTDPGLIGLSGISAICQAGTIYSYTNSTGSDQTITIAGNAASTAVLAVSAFARSFGQGVAFLGLSDGSGYTTIPNTERLIRVTSESITHTNSTDTVRILVQPSTTVQWVLNQLELGTAAAAGVTSPIIVAGASATRSATIVSLPITNNNILPVNNFTISAEFTPSTSHQDVGSANGCSLLGVYQASPLNRLVVRGIFITKTLAGVDSDTNKVAVFLTKNKTFNFAIKQSSVDGVKAFYNGESSYNYNNLPGDITITSGTLLIGIDNPSNTTRQFIGQVKNFKVFNTAIADEDLKELTAKNSFSLLDNYGPTIFDNTNTNRVWALKKDTNGNYSQIVWSDDFLETDNVFFNLPEVTAQPTLAQDPYGNFYYQSNGTTILKRVDGQTKEVTDVITFFPTGRSWTWLQWHWGVDKAGNIYTCAYSLGLGDNHYVWYSTNKGVSFTRYDALTVQYPAGVGYRHIHSLHVNPVTNKLYVSFGDTVRGTVVTKASTGLLLPNGVFATDWDVVTESTNPGPVGITFTNDTTILATDNVGSPNFIKHVTGTTATNVYAFPKPIDLTPSYFIRAVGDLELWGCAYNETSATTGQSTLWVLKREYVGAQWYLADVYQGYDTNKVGLDFYEICWDCYGTSPLESPFIFGTVLKKSTGERTLIKVKRV